MYAPLNNDPFASIDLSGNKAVESRSLLKAGRHIVTSRSVEVVTNGPEKHVDMVLGNDEGEITVRFRLFASNDKAREIAGDLLKSFCLFTGHPSPDKPLPAGIHSFPLLKGKVVGIRVEDREYVKDGETRKTPDVKGFFPAAKGVAEDEPAKPRPNDEVPF